MSQLRRKLRFPQITFQAASQIVTIIFFILLVLVPAIVLLSWNDPLLLNLVRGQLLAYDAFYFLGIIGFYALWWALSRKDKQAFTKNILPEERKLGADSLRSQITAGILASSLILAAASFLLSKPFYLETATIPNALMDLHRAVVWLVISLLVGLWNIFSIAGRVNELNVAREPYYNILSVGQLFSILFGVLNLTSALSWTFGL